MNDEVTVPGLLGEILKLTALLKASQASFDPDAPDHGRSGVKNALIAFQWFVARVCPNGAELVLPINELLYALEDLDISVVTSRNAGIGPSPALWRYDI
jgi:hypothetical protein